MSMLVRLGGRSTMVSDIAGKIIRGQNACGVYKTQNGFAKSVAKYYADPGAVMTNSTKILPDGRTITQQLWSWANGAVVALTRKSDGFFSFVQKNSSGKVTKSVISKNSKHLAEKGTYRDFTGGKLKRIPYENHVNGDNVARLVDGKLVHSETSASSAERLAQEARKNAVEGFRSIG